MHNIVLTSQVIEHGAGFQVHGIFPSFEAAAKHIVKDAELSDEESRLLLSSWLQGGLPTDKHRSYIVSEGNPQQRFAVEIVETHWEASIQPLRNEEGV